MAAPLSAQILITPGEKDQRASGDGHRHGSQLFDGHHLHPSASITSRRAGDGAGLGQGTWKGRGPSRARTGRAGKYPGIEWGTLLEG